MSDAPARKPFTTVESLFLQAGVEMDQAAEQARQAAAQAGELVEDEPAGRLARVRHAVSGWVSAVVPGAAPPSATGGRRQWVAGMAVGAGLLLLGAAAFFGGEDAPARPALAVAGGTDATERGPLPAGHDSAARSHAGSSDAGGRHRARSAHKTTPHAHR